MTASPEDNAAPPAGGRTLAEVERENTYLKARLAQLDADLVDLAAENRRLREDRERLHGRQALRGAPNPLGGGQSA